MTPERWQEVKRLFAGAVTCNAEERAAFLDRACAGDEALRAEVETLLASEEREVSVVDGDLFDLFGRMLAHDRSGRRLGHYRIVRDLGQGGMAAVYAAVRDDDQYHQEVAIKLIRRGMDSETMIARFRQERQILAHLDHPNIARLLDGGVTDEGLPYLVMEVIDGEPIDAYCDRRRLAVAARLELFRTVCAAVHSAHRNLVVHRDLKPSNILVTAEGTPKLLDFGIAKLLEPEAGALAAELTVEGPRPMTLGYASPEQVLGRPVTTASDVYALGVLLYRLLTGRRPYDLERLSRREIERVVCEQEPERPSTAVTRPPADPTTEPAPAELGRKLRGDLDLIVMKAMRKEPERRYGSAEQLSEDIRRHLEGLPVIARDATLAYRAGKFVRRHRLGVAAAALVFLSLVGGIVATTWQMRVAQRQRLTAQTVSDFLVDLFELSDPEKARGREVPARELLERSADEIGRLEGQPEVQATLMDAMGRVYLNLGLLDEAEPLLEKALARRRQIFGEEHPAIADSQAHLAELLTARARYVDAERLHREALARRRRQLEDDDERLAESENDLALVLVALGRLDEAEELLGRALARQRRVLGEEHETVARTLNNLALALSEKSRFPEAVDLYRGALEQNRKLLGEDHPEVMTTLNNLAMVLCKLGEHEEARSLFEQAQALEREVLGESHWSLATTQNNLASCLRITGDHEGAGALFRSSLELRRTTLGPDHPYVAASLNNLGQLLFERQDLDGAEDHFRQALEIYRRFPGGRHRDTAGPLNNLAAVLHRRGRLTEAEELYREALEMNRERYGEAHEWIAGNLYNLGDVSRRQGKPEAAEVFLRQALAMHQQLFGEEHRRVAGGHHALGLVLSEVGRLEEAEAEYRAAVTLRRKLLGGEHRDVAISSIGLGRVLIERGQAGQAEAPLREALEILRRHPPEGRQPGLAMTQSALGRCLTSLGSYREAESLLSAGHAYLDRAFGADHRWTVEARQGLVELYQKSGRPDDADRHRGLRD